jgi:hypothetical protein
VVSASVRKYGTRRAQAHEHRVIALPELLFQDQAFEIICTQTSVSLCRSALGHAEIT